MSHRIAALMVLALAVTPAQALAQSSQRFTAGGSLHATRTWDDESLLGTGGALEGRVGLNLTRKTQLELLINRIPYERHFDSGVSTEGRSIFTGLMLKYDFTSGGARPYVLAGYGLSHHQGSRISPGSGRADTSTLDHGYVLGTGFVIHRGRWQVGPEARVYMLAIERDASAAMILSGGVRANISF